MLSFLGRVNANSPVWLGGSVLFFVYISDYTSQNTFDKVDVLAPIQAPSSVQ